MQLIAQYRLSQYPVRLRDIALLVVSCAIILLAGLSSLFEVDDSLRQVRNDCELFYQASGAPAVKHCIDEMQARRSNLARP
jgi:hypothetical protein